MRSFLKNFFLKGDQRSLLVKKNIIASLLLKGCAILVSFMLVPMTLGYLNEYEYGIWLTLNSVLSWVYIFDIGLGNGMRNKLTEALAKKDFESGKIYVSTSFFCMFIIAAAIFIIFFACQKFIDWYEFMNVDPKKIFDLGGIVSIVFGLTCLLFVFKLVGNIYMAYQLPAVNNFLGFAGSLISLIIIFILTKTTAEGSLKDVAIYFSAAPVAVYLIAYPITFKKFKEIKPSFKAIKLIYFKSLASLGINFMLIQLAVLVIFMTSNIIISKLFGPEEVTPYNIAFKYFSIVSMIFSIILAPIWSAVTDAYTRGDYSWIKRSLNKMLRIWMILVIGLVVMVAGAKLFYHLWVGDDVSVPFQLSLWMAIYTAITTLGNLFANIINGFGKLRIQLIYAIAQGIIYIPLAVFCGKMFGVQGILISLSAICIFSTLIAGYQCKLLLSQQAKGIWNK